MKKILYTLVLLLMFIGTTNAAKCNVVSGTGKNIGDEIACGTEHFYVISNDGINIKMLGKYNLLAGATYDKVELDNYKTDNLNSIYNLDIIKNKIIKEYIISSIEYTYDSESKTYTISAVYFWDEYLYHDQVVWFDEAFNSEADAIKSSFVSYYLNNGYNLRNFIYDTKDLIVGMTIATSDVYEFKNIYLSVDDLPDLFKNSEVKELLDEGYEVEDWKYNNSKIFYISLKKDVTYDATNVIFDTPTQGDYEYEAVLSSHATIKSKIAEGYSIRDYGYAGYRYGVYLYKENFKTSQIHFLQDEKAAGIHGEVAKPIYPFYGIVKNNVDIFELVDLAENVNLNIGNSYGGEYFQDFNIDNYRYLKMYYYSLVNNGYSIKSVSTLSVNELNEVVYNLTGEEIPLQYWYENKIWIADAGAYILGSVKGILGEKAPWLYSTTYWLKTKATDQDETLFYVSTLGDLCGSSICKDEPTIGLRPLVTISANDIVYSITTKVNGEGKVVPSTETSQSGNTVTFIVSPGEGYVLSEVKVTDEKGNVITFTENTFTMPEANVLIEATFTVENSETSTMGTFISCCLLIIFAGIYLTIKYINKMKWLNI